MGIFDRLFGRKEKVEKGGNEDVIDLGVIMDKSDTVEVITVKTDGSLIKQEMSKDDSLKASDAYTHALRGVSYEKEGKWMDAIKEHKKATAISLENDPNAAIYHTNLGVCYFQIGKIEDALQHLEIAIKLDPTYKRAHRQRDDHWYEKRKAMLKILIEIALKDENVRVRYRAEEALKMLNSRALKDEDSNVRESANLWENIPAKGNLIGRDPRTREIFQGPLNPKVRLLCATPECIEYIDKVQSKGIIEGAILFSLMDEASIVCFMNDKRWLNELKKPEPNDHKNPELTIEYFAMDSYPILRVCLLWKRVDDDRFTTLETANDIRDINLQYFFSNFLKSDTCWIYVLSAENKIPMYCIEARYDKKRMQFYAQEIDKAIKHFHEIPRDKLDFLQALKEFYNSHPLVDE